MVKCTVCLGHPMVCTPSCSGCRGDGYTGPGFLVSPEEPTDVRMALAETYRDYAKQAELVGRHFEAHVWRNAAEIAQGFTTHRKVPL